MVKIWFTPSNHLFFVLVFFVKNSISAFSEFFANMSYIKFYGLLYLKAQGVKNPVMADERCVGRSSLFGNSNLKLSVSSPTRDIITVQHGHDNHEKPIPSLPSHLQ